MNRDKARISSLWKLIKAQHRRKKRRRLLNNNKLALGVLCLNILILIKRSVIGCIRLFGKAGDVTIKKFKEKIHKLKEDLLASGFNVENIFKWTRPV